MFSFIALWQNISTPPAPPKKAEPSRLVNMFNQDNNPTAVTPPSSNSTGIAAGILTVVFI